MASKRTRTETLRAKFLRVTIPLIFLSVIGVFSVIEYLTHRSAVERLERSLEGQIQTQAAALANPLWNLDDEQIGLALAALVTSREILSAQVYGEEQELVSAAGEVAETASSGDLVQLSREIVFDAGAGPKVIGTLEFVATREHLWQQTLNRLLIAAVIALVAVAMEVAAALYALRTIIGRPLAALLASIEQRRTGGSRQPVIWESSDELGQVIGAYNEMQGKQAAYEAELSDARDTLEDRVVERTAELATARDESARARTRLNDAIEAISEGFSLYDNDDRLVAANSRYKELLNIDDDMMQTGQPFQSILSAAVDRGLLADAQGDPERWVEERMARHLNPGPEYLQRYANGRYLRVSERRTEDGGTVAVYSDITELKQREEELATKSAQLEQLSSQLAKYLSPQVYELIFQGRQEVKITASRKKLTVFFSDIAGFTETADRMESEELTQVLNQYLTEMSKIALDHGATIDKFIGDAIMVFFGDPETRGVREDARACVRMAIAMRDRLRELTGEWLAAGIAHPFRCRVGIHTDFCTVGNFGSEDRLDYTIIGRGVNIASRLEQISEPGEILISYETYAHVADEIDCEEQGEVKVKGMAYPITTYCVKGISHEAAVEPAQQAQSLVSILESDPSDLSAHQREDAINRLSKALDRLAAQSNAEDAAE
ncbi:adenylate/guanylate cyclase domain-containing protein [Ruegeria meonggei]|uniref:adenylate/guanylate cyclase domain-containing protein n=1 Tax=Ruegeria meonggei TaxID=1446476 RepID=UPI00366F87F1